MSWECARHGRREASLDAERARAWYDRQRACVAGWAGWRKGLCRPENILPLKHLGLWGIGCLNRTLPLLGGTASASRLSI